MTLVRWTGNKRPGDGTSRIVLEGTSSNPVREISRGGAPAELSEEELEQYGQRYEFSEGEESNDSNDGEGDGGEQPPEPEPQQPPGVETPSGARSATSTRKTR